MKPRHAKENVILSKSGKRRSKKKKERSFQQKKSSCKKKFPKHNFSNFKTSEDSSWAAASPSTSNSDLITYPKRRAQNYRKSFHQTKNSSLSNAMGNASQLEVSSSSDETADEYDPADNSFLLDDESHEEREEERERELPSFMVHGYNDVLSSDFDTDDDLRSQEHQMDVSELPQSIRKKANACQELRYVDDDDDDDENGPKEEIKFFSDYKSGTIVTVLHHPMSCTFYGKAQVRVISGSVDILGYNLHSQMDDFLFLYSFQQLSALQIRTNHIERKSSSHWKDVKNKLEECVSQDLTVPVLNSCRDSAVILLLRKHDLAYAVDFACSYIPCPLPCHDDNLKMLRNKGFIVVSHDDNTIRMSRFYESVSESILQAIRLCDINEQNAPRILVCGKRNFGKSTALRYFVNRALSSLSKVYYLDADLGQSEFTPPGCVSLVEVTKPLLGPPFTHPKVPVKMAYYGNNTIRDIRTYISCIDKVVEFYKSNFTKFPLFINTLGWMSGLGKESLDHIRNVVAPNIEVELVPNEISGEIDYASELQKESIKQEGTQRYEIPINFSRNSEQFSAPTKRALSVLTYFGRCQPYFLPVMTLNAMKPLCVRVEDVAIHIMHSVFHKCIIQAINASLVALCVVDESQILCCVDNEHQPKRLAADADFSECVGFGFVRAIDITKNLLYILTPEPYNVLKRVNTLVKGNILMPDEVFEKQEICGKPLPYVKQIYGKKNPLSQKIRR